MANVPRFVTTRSSNRQLKDIGEDPERPGSKEKPEIMIEGIRAYHLSFSRKRASPPDVKEPRHFLLYRRRGKVIEVGRILHDAVIWSAIFRQTIATRNRRGAIPSPMRAVDAAYCRKSICVLKASNSESCVTA